MSIQSIINDAESIEINRRRVVGIQYTRNEIARTSELTTRNPWRLTIKNSSLKNYNEVRSQLEEIDRLDRNQPEVISFSNNPNLAYMFAYQGDVYTTSSFTSVTVQSFTGTNLILTNLPALASNEYIFKKGDFIQVDSYPYPFTSRTDVLRGTGNTVSITTHRPNFIGTATHNHHILVGNDVQFNVFCPNMPSYTLVAGGYGSLVSWNGDFQLYEYTGTVL